MSQNTVHQCSCTWADDPPEIVRYDSRCYQHGRVQVDTGPYELGNGKPPHGRGLWAFRILGSTIFLTGTFDQARREAVAIARETGATTVEVLP